MNSPRSDNDRPSQQRSGESSSSSGAWKPKLRVTDETRDNVRSAPKPPENWGRSDENNSWRTREKKRLNRFIYFII